MAGSDVVDVVAALLFRSAFTAPPLDRLHEPLTDLFQTRMELTRDLGPGRQQRGEVVQRLARPGLHSGLQHAVAVLDRLEP